MKYLLLSIIITFVLRDSIAQNKLDTLILLQKGKWELIFPSPKKITTGIQFTSSTLTHFFTSKKLIHHIFTSRNKNSIQHHFYLSHPKNFTFDTLQNDKITSKKHKLIEDTSMQIKVNNYNISFDSTNVGKVLNGSHIIAINSNGNISIYQILELNQHYLKLKDSQTSIILEFTKKKNDKTLPLQ